MPLKITSPKTLLHNLREKQATKKARHKQHDVGVSDASQGLMESASGTKRPEQTPVRDRQTKKWETKSSVLQVSAQADRQDQELPDELMATPRPTGAPPTYGEVVQHSGELDIPSSPTSTYREDVPPLFSGELKKQTYAAISAFEKADKALRALEKKVESLEQELAEKIREKGSGKGEKLREKLQKAKSKLSEEESVRKQLEKNKDDLEKTLDEATAAEIDEGNLKHKSGLADIIKPWLTLNKEELAALKTRKDKISKELDRTKKLKNKKEKNHKACLEALQKEMQTANKASQKTAGQGGAKALHQKILDAQNELDEAEAQLKTQQQLLAEVKSEISVAGKNSDSLIDFAASFATNLRELYKLQKKDNAVARAEMAKLQSFTAPKLVIDTPDGKVQVENLKIKLKSLEFKRNAAKQWIPVLRVESMSGQISVPMPDNQSIMVALNLQDVTLDLDTDLGTPMHRYVTSRFGLTGAASALLDLPKALSSLLPRNIIARGKKVDIALKDFSPATIAAAAHLGMSTPVSDLDKLFEALGFGIDAELEEISVKTRGGVTVDGKAKGAVIQYNPDPLKKGQTSTSRKVHIQADHGSLSVSDGLPVVADLLKELEIKDPLSLIPGMAQNQGTVSMAKLKNLSQKLHIEVSKPDIEFSRELKKKVVAKKWGGLRKKRSWALTGANAVNANIASLDITNAGDVKAQAKVKDLQLHVEPVRGGGNKLEAGASHINLDIDSPTTLLSPDGVLVKTGLLKEGMDITGKARLSLESPQIKGQLSETQQSVTLKFPTLEIAANDKSSIISQPQWHNAS